MTDENSILEGKEWERYWNNVQLKRERNENSSSSSSPSTVHRLRFVKKSPMEKIVIKTDYGIVKDEIEEESPKKKSRESILRASIKREVLGSPYKPIEVDERNDEFSAREREEEIQHQTVSSSVVGNSRRKRNRLKPLVPSSSSPPPSPLRMDDLSQNDDFAPIQKTKKKTPTNQKILAENSQKDGNNSTVEVVDRSKEGEKEKEDEDEIIESLTPKNTSQRNQRGSQKLTLFMPQTQDEEIVSSASPKIVNRKSQDELFEEDDISSSANSIISPSLSTQSGVQVFSLPSSIEIETTPKTTNSQRRGSGNRRGGNNYSGKLGLRPFKMKPIECLENSESQLM